MKSHTRRYHRAYHWVAGGLLLLAAAALWGCSSGPSHFRRSVAVSDTFEQSRIITDHQYYYYGHPHAPVAMVAIKDGYRLNAPKWTPISPDEKELNAWVGRMLNKPGSEYNIDPNGAVISDDSGTPIGMWYSVFRLPILTFTSEKEFTLSDPTTSFPIRNRDPERLFRRI